MNTAGLPGTGIGGLFYLVAIVYMLIAEVLLTLQGPRDAQRGCCRANPDVRNESHPAWEVEAVREG